MSVFHRFCNLFSLSKAEEEIDAELQSHIEMKIEEGLAAGLSEEAARRRALVEFGNPAVMKEQTTGSDALMPLNGIAFDFRHALRQLWKAPGFTATAILTLALGIGATTAIFTLVHAVLLKSLPVTRPEELYRIGDKINRGIWGGYTETGEFSVFSYELYRYFRDHTDEFSDLAGFQSNSTNLGVRRADSTATPEFCNGQFVSGNFFRTFGIGSWIGRVFQDTDDHEGAPPAAVMSYRIWQEKYGSDSSVVGSTFNINGTPFTVIGVAAPGFFGASLRSTGTPDFWLPVAAEPLINGNRSVLKLPDSHWLEVIGRVRPGVRPKALEAKLRVLLHAWQMSHFADMSSADREELPKTALYLTPGGAGVNDMREQYQYGLRLLFAAAGCVLLIACANLANLLLVRGIGQKLQTSLRMALGAPRVRLIRKALVESVTLGLLGGAAGLVVAYTGSKMILRLAFANQYVPINPAPSWPVLLFTLALSLLTGICFGIAPAWIAANGKPLEALGGANRSVGQKVSLPQRLLVIGQAALAVVLLSAAVMLARSLTNMKHSNFGFETANRYLLSIDPRLAGYQVSQLDSLYRRLQERLQQIPGVRAVGILMYAPMTGNAWTERVVVAGKPEPRSEDDAGSDFVRVTPGTFTALGSRILAGRSIMPEDTATSRRVAVVSETFAKKFLSGENAVGKHIGQFTMNHAGDFEIVGVTQDIRFHEVDPKLPVPPMVFLPETQFTTNETPTTINAEVQSHYLHKTVLWALGNPADLEAQARRAVTDVDPKLMIATFQSYDDVVRLDFAQDQMIARLTSLFGALALVLTAVGLYGVTAYMVQQRVSEIGIRMALGAGRLSVLKIVLRGAFLHVGIGLTIGIPAAVAAGKAIANQLFSVKPYDPAVISTAALGLVLTTFIAAAVPAVRAASVNPMQALRSQ